MGSVDDFSDGESEWSENILSTVSERVSKRLKGSTENSQGRSVSSLRVQEAPNGHGSEHLQHSDASSSESEETVTLAPGLKSPVTDTVCNVSIAPSKTAATQPPAAATQGKNSSLDGVSISGLTERMRAASEADMENVMDLKKDESIDVAGQDEYLAENQERHAFLREYKIDMPPPVQTFRQRYNAQNKSQERFVLENMQLENFKSYANKVSVGAFNSKFTCIIGPNGSGKSNTIDALLFVFGYNNKRIRASKTAELIHKSDAFPNFRYCRVSVTFKRIIPGADAYSYTDVEGSRYTVTRQATRDGKSTFFLDGREVSRDAVRARLMKDGIDLDQNRFLILQGEVEQIAMMKPKGKKEGDEEMLEYVEEIVGTHQYKEPIVQLNVLVEKLAREEELQNIKVHEFGKQMSGMEAVKNETERFLRTENEVISRSHTILQLQRAAVTVKRDVALVRFDSCKKDLDAKQFDLDSLLKSRQTLEQEHEDKKRYIRELEKGDSAEEKNFGTLETNRNKAQTRKKTLEESVPKLETTKKKLENQLSSMENAPERLRAEIEALDEDVTNTNQDLELYESTLRKKRDGLAKQIGDRHDRVTSLETRLAEVKKPLMAKRREVDNKEVERNAFRAKYTRAVEHRDDLVRRQVELTAESAQAADEIAKLRVELPIKKKSLVDNKSRIAQLRGELSTLRDQIGEKRAQIDKAAEANRIQTNDRLLKRLLEAQRDGDLEGIVGRLGDLATIDSKYDVAVSTNFGGRLDNIVVTNVQASKDVLQYLRDNSLGRANLLVLDKLTECVGQFPDRLADLPENSERIFDLINCSDNIYRPLFYYVLRDTLVTDTLDQATEIAFGRKKYCVIALDGKQVDGVHGNMSGGGDTVIRGKIRTNAQGFPSKGYTGPPLDQLEAQCLALDNEAQGKQTELAAVEIAIVELEPLIRQAEQALTVNTVKEKDGVAELKRLKEDIEKQASMIREAQPDEQEEARFEAEVNELNAKLEEESARVQKIQTELDTVNGEIVAITKRELDEWQTKEKKAKTALAKLEKEVYVKNSELDNHAASVSKLQRDIEKNDKAISAKHTDLEMLIAELDKMEKEYIAARDLLKEKKDRLQADKAAEKAMLDGITVFDSKIETLENEAAQYKAMVDKADNEAKSCDKQWKLLNKEMEAMKLNDLHTAEPDVLKAFSTEELAKVSVKELEAEIAGFKLVMNTMQPKMNIWTEYYKLSDSRDGVMKAVEEVRRKRKLAYSLYMEYKNRRFSEFMDALRIIQSVLKTTYRQLTLGGDASLEPMDRFDPFSEGLEFMVKPKTKSWKNISYLSGGEKTISSLALIFALHYFKPTPFYIMDEIDAALDFRNTSIIAFFVKERALSAQFIIVSLRNQMFETAYRLIGICKPEHQSMAMFIDPPKFVMTDEEREQEGEPRPTATTIGRQTTGSLFSQATQGVLLQADEDQNLS